jgi:N-acetylneuraminate synthase
MLANPVNKDDLTSFRSMKETFEKSIVSLVDIPQGTRIDRTMIGIKKPGTGIPAAKFSEVLGKHTARPIGAGRLLTAADVVWGAEHEHGDA